MTPPFGLPATRYSDGLPVDRRRLPRIAATAGRSGDEPRRTEQGRRSHGRARQGHPGRRRIHRHHQEALRRHRRRIDRGQSPRLSRDDVPLRRGDAKHISGVILYDETIWQKAKDGTPLVDSSRRPASIPGIKVDEGTKPLPNCPGELITVGLDKLADRLPKYYEQGARFAKWRAVIDIGARHSELHLHPRQCACAGALCRALPGGADRADRRAGSADGRRPRHRPLLRGHRMGAEGNRSRSSTTSASRSKASCSSRTWRSPARRARSRPRVEEVAEKTVKMLKNCVPGAVPGIAFLSGGQSDEEATAHLDAMNKIGGLPWKLTFSYGRALQAAPQKAWARQDRERRGGAARLHASRRDERPRLARPVEAGPGKEGGLIAACCRPGRGPRLVPALRTPGTPCHCH